jgi:UDP-hydrolysing UDP-N-acetyl-D-glucosamine 2-epimerase
LNKPRHIVVVTGTRAEYGLLEPVMRAIAAEPRLRLSVIVCGTHLVTETWRDVSFPIAAKISMQKPGDRGRAADVTATARGIAGFGEAFAVMRPDFVVVLGDRIEAFAAASAASIGGFRVAHIHGGDRAEGVSDEAMRHAISKLSHLHFAATSLSRKRLIKMGEVARLVLNVGSPAADGLSGVIPADGPEIIVLQHPIGASDEQEKEWMRGTLRATAKFSRLLMAPNRDAGSAGVRAAMKGLDVAEHFPRDAWLSLLAGARVIVGNSSAGLIEAAILKVPCVNIGPREAGREKPGSVIDCEYGKGNVRAAVKRALKLNLKKTRHPYGDGRSGERIAEVLATIALDRVTVRKHNSY